MRICVFIFSTFFFYFFKAFLFSFFFNLYILYIYNFFFFFFFAFHVWNRKSHLEYLGDIPSKQVYKSYSHWRFFLVNKNPFHQLFNIIKNGFFSVYFSPHPSFQRKQIDNFVTLTLITLIVSTCHVMTVPLPR